jgi:hypothetical protein
MKKLATLFTPVLANMRETCLTQHPSNFNANQSNVAQLSGQNTEITSAHRINAIKTCKSQNGALQRI